VKPPSGFGRMRQSEIYVGGARGQMPRVPFDPEKLESAAATKMSKRAFAYVAGGAGVELSVRANRAAFDRWRIVPRMLHDVSKRDTSVELFGRRVPTPFLLAPVGVLELAHAEADIAVARAATTEGVPMIFSNQASRTMEDCAAEMGDSPRWFQLYSSTSNELIESFMTRAAACGCEAIVVTLDTTSLGWRTRDLDLAYLPFLEGKGIAQYTHDPVFQKLLDEATPAPTGRVTPTALRTLASLTRAYPGAFWSNLRSPRPRLAVQVFTDVYSRSSLAWDDLGYLLEKAPLPLLLKGILARDDAKRAVEAGVSGIVVSNHGGRQVDGSIAALDALPPVVEAVRGRIPVLFDSGIRTGADVFKALALGATAVLLGRPYVYGLALDGENGVRAVIRNLHADFDLTLGLSGYARAAELNAGAVVPAA
jgi:lactate 2-monooxygenase